MECALASGEDELAAPVHINDWISPISVLTANGKHTRSAHCTPSKLSLLSYEAPTAFNHGHWYEVVESFVPADQASGEWASQRVWSCVLAAGVTRA